MEALGAGLGAIQSGMAASAANKQASRNYKHQLQVRERKWMGDRSLYQTQLVQHSEQVDLANVAAQRAYTRTQISLNNAQSLAILQNQEDWRKMLAAEGTAEVKAASRGIGGKSVDRQLVMAKSAFGMTQAMRTRGLMMAQYEAKESNISVRRQLKGFLNESYGRVSIQPVPDVAPPKPVMQNVMLAAVLGGAQGALSNYTPKAEPPLNTPQTPQTPIPPMQPLPEFQAPIFGGGGYSGKVQPSDWGKLPTQLPNTFNPYSAQQTQSQIPFANVRL